MIIQKGFIAPLRVENVDPINWRILEDFPWIGSKGDIFICEKGMLTDFASVPWWTQSILPRTGTWTKAAVLHDKMCDRLNEIYRHNLHVSAQANPGSIKTLQLKPTFTAVDADAIFRKNAREDGTDPIRSELLWVGVRLGALANPARRGGWLKTVPRVFADVVAVLAVVYIFIFFVLWISGAILHVG